MSKKLDDAVAAILAASQPTGCWATRIDGEARELVAKLKEQEQVGNRPSRSLTAKVLRDHFDVRVAGDAVSRHLRGVCSCGDS